MKRSFESLGGAEEKNRDKLFGDLASEFGRLILEKIQDPELTPEARDAEAEVLGSLESRMEEMRRTLEEKTFALEGTNVRNTYLINACIIIGGLLTLTYPFAGFLLGVAGGLVWGLDVSKRDKIESMREFNEVLHNSSLAINNRKEVIDQSDKYPEGE